MSNRLNGAPGESGLTGDEPPGPPPRNISDMQNLARKLYGTGKKFEGVGAICDCIILLSNGVRRCLEDNKAMKERIEKLEQIVKP